MSSQRCDGKREPEASKRTSDHMTIERRNATEHRRSKNPSSSCEWGLYGASTELGHFKRFPAEIRQRIYCFVVTSNYSTAILFETEPQLGTSDTELNSIQTSQLSSISLLKHFRTAEWPGAKGLLSTSRAMYRDCVDAMASMPFHIDLKADKALPCDSILYPPKSLQVDWHNDTYLPQAGTFRKTIMHIPIPRLIKGDCGSIWTRQFWASRYYRFLKAPATNHLELKFEAEEPDSSWWDFEKNILSECMCKRPWKTSEFGRHVSIVEAILGNLFYPLPYGKFQVFLPRFMESDAYIVLLCEKFGEEDSTLGHRFSWDQWDADFPWSHSSEDESRKCQLLICEDVDWSWRNV